METHGIYPDPLILAINYGMIITCWSAENYGLEIFVGRSKEITSDK